MIHRAAEHHLRPRTRAVAARVIVLTLVILALAITWISRHLRTELRSQIAGRDAEVLAAVVMAGGSGPDSAENVASLEEPAGQFQAVLTASRLRGVIAVRLFDANGTMLCAFPPTVTEAELAPEDVNALAAGGKISRFHPDARPADLFLDPSRPHVPEPRHAPLLEVLIPIRPGDANRTSAVAQFLIDGQNIASDFARLDSNLARHGILVFLVGGFVCTVGLAWTFHRLQRTHRLLARRTSDLASANRELTLAAKTTAVGAITAQLVHGLKSPLFGLRTFLDARKAASAHHDRDWEVATETARQMQHLIADVIRVVGESKGFTDYEVSTRELIDLLQTRLAPIAGPTDVLVRIQPPPDLVLDNHQANLLILILENLVQNAIQATPRGGIVRIESERKPSRLEFTVSDEGPGIAESVRPRLFSPCNSTKSGGSGIGLAISRQLATHLGADLSLVSTGPQGTTFALSLPLQVPGDSVNSPTEVTTPTGTASRFEAT